MIHGLIRFWNALSIKGYVIFWVACVFISCAAVAAGWLRTERQHNEMTLQIRSDAEILDTGHQLKARLLEEAYAAQGLHESEERWWIAFMAQLAFLIGAGSLVLLLRVVRPIGELRRTAARFGAGDYGVRAQVVRDDEIGALCRTLNGLADHVVSHMAEQRRTEEELRSLALFPDENPNPVMRSSKDGTVLYANKAATRLLNAWNGAAGAAAPAALNEEVQKVLGAGANQESKIRCGDRVFSFVLAPIKDRGYVNLYGRDITDRERLEEALVRSRDELEQRVRERTAELLAANKALQAEILARGRVENALRESRERFRLIMENSPDTVSILDRDLVYRWVLNPSPPYTPEEFIGQQFGRFAASPEDAEQRTRLARGVLETGQAVRFEASDRVAGAVGHFEVTYQPWRDGEGAIIGVAAYAHDITKRRQAEEALRRSESLFRAITDNTPDAIFLKDREGRVLFANPAALAIVGRSAENVIGKKDQEIHTDPEAVRAIQENDQRIMNSDKMEAIEETIHGPAGPRIYLSTKAPYHDAAGRVIGLVGASLDITERKAAEEALRQSEETIRALLDATMDAMILLDASGKVLVMNEISAKRHGKTVAEMVGRCVFDTLPPALARARKARVDEVFRSGRPVRFEDERDGKWFDNVIYPIRDPQGKVTRVAVCSPDITERKFAEQALQESEARFRDVFNDAPIGMMLVSADGRILQANRAHCEWLGYSGQELAGRNIEDITYSEDREETSRVIRQMREGGARVEGYRKRYLRKNGEVVWGEVSVSIIRDADGKLSYTIAQIVDITERKRAEQALRENDETIRALLNATTDQVFLLDTAGVILAANETGARGWGMSAAQAVGACAYDFMTPAATESRKAHFARSVQSGQPLHFEDEHRGVWYDSGVYPIRDSQGKVTRMAVFARDITERRRAEQALRESEQRYRELFEASPVALIEEDWAFVRRRAEQVRADGVSDVRAWFLSHPEEALLCFRRIQRLDVNKAALRLFRAANKKELLANIGRLGSEEARNSTVSAVAGMVAGNEFFEAEMPFRTLTGEKRSLLVSISAAPVAEKSLPRYIVSLSDVTDLRRAQQEAIEQRQAAQLQRMESLAVTGCLAAGVAHEINNPLQGIVAQLALLSDELPEPLRQGRRLELIHRGIERIAEIVRNLLQLHRAPPEGEESCAASSVIPGLADMVSAMAANQYIRLEVSVSPPEMTIPMSASALTQVLLNLALNAIDAMPQGGVIRIEAKQTRETALVSVSDTGVGIPSEHRTRLFSPFFTTKGPKGTGLGLSVTHSLVTSAGGTIVVSDRKDGGTTFAIRFENEKENERTET